MASVKISKPTKRSDIIARYKLARIRKHYAAIERLELSIDDATEQRKVAAEIRFRFASETIQRAVQGLRERGVPKPERKAWLRKIVSGNV